MELSNTMLRFSNIEDEPDELVKSSSTLDNTITLWEGRDIDTTQLYINSFALITLLIFLYYNRGTKPQLVHLIAIAATFYYTLQIVYTPAEINDVDLEIELLFNVKNQSVKLLVILIFIVATSKISSFKLSKSHQKLLIPTIALLSMNIIHIEHKQSSLSYRQERLVRENILNSAVIIFSLYVLQVLSEL